jgi:DNA-directed RNA polymerase subunit RPC12/RpoP
MEYRKPTGRDWKRTVIYLALYIITISVGAFLLMPRGVAGALAWAAVVIGGAFLLVRWHAETTAYRCRNCRHEFEISVFTDAISPHGPGGGGWKYLRCPRCGQRTRTEILLKK